ncbi:amidase [Carboxylicivirga sediminis]|uniref:Amidase n=1 Tax=Carboxylicivirga sediminis TaxID=2006564 RepID=A0A941IZQ2_9BACT|nr:amidase [Carboxylicivirga sediminis]MBR8536817.1 amidase [Carboxylicivirga sediminis]
MKRRDFLLSSVLSAVGISLSACSKPGHANQTKRTHTEDFPLSDISVVELQEKMKSGELTSEDIVQLYLNRIEQIDKKGPGINAVVEINPDAIDIARSLDEERSLGNLRGPLHGIPVLIKENIDTGDQMITSAGSLALNNHRAKKDAFIVSKLRQAGAVILGKTNLSEWANFRSTNSSSGWSSRGGQTRNPYVLDRTPCGSSSGSAVAVAANLVPLAVGTETDGSIVCPSGINGVVGIKPTVGLLSRTGIIPISDSQDTAGPMACSVRDAALLLMAMVGEDEADTATANQPAQAGIYLNFDDNVLSGARIGYLSKSSAFDKRVSDIMNEVVNLLKEKGADVIEVKLSEEVNELGQYEWTLLLCEFKDGLDNYLKSHPECGFKSLGELIEFNKKNANGVMPWFDQEIFEAANATKGLDDPKYKVAKEKCLELSRDKGIDKLMAEHNLDAIIAPTNGAAWCIDYVNGDNFGGGSSQLAAVSGYPSITVPAGDIKGLPIGVSFFGLPYTESRLIQIAHLYEKVSKKRFQPQFINSLIQ